MVLFKYKVFRIYSKNFVLFHNFNNNHKRRINHINFNTAQFRYTGQYRTDITYKSTNEIGKLFKPSSKIVIAYKNNQMTKEEYTKQYYELMRNSYQQNKEKWQDVLNQSRLVFVCFCNLQKVDFCHRLLLKDILIKLGAIYDGEIEI